MIRLTLRCFNGHEFEGWFQDGQSFAMQQEKHLIACPSCGICDVVEAAAELTLER